MKRTGLYDDGVLARFVPKVQADENGCWIWTAGVDRLGYGTFFVHGRTRVAHRIAYELWRGSIPAGLELDHLCRIRRCVNPYHLEPVTHAENVRRGGPAQKTECVNGHPYDEENTYVRPSGGSRQCRRCITARSRDRRKAVA